MATIETVRAALEAAVLSGTSATLALEEQHTRSARIPPGATYVIVAGSPIGQDSDSNVSRLVGVFTVKVLHYLADRLDAGAYLRGNAVTDQAAIMVRSFYRALSGVKEAIETPELTLPTRLGNVIEYTVTTQLSIVP